jgi:hypothetical protein
MIPQAEMDLGVFDELADLLSKRKRIEVLIRYLKRDARLKDHPNLSYWIGGLTRADKALKNRIELVTSRIQWGIYS